MGTALDLKIRRNSSFYFPVDLDVESRCFLFQITSLEELRRNTFLDNRFLQAGSEINRLELEQLAYEHWDIANKIGFLFHTSFCCSTLLARLLDFPSHSLVLKEPLVLRRLSDAELIGKHELALQQTALDLLFRSVAEDFAIVVKPTHVALNIANSMLSCQPEARALLITSTLEDFLVSNIKKSTESKQKVPELVERFMSASDLPSRLPPQAFAPPTFLCGVALQWHAQQSIIHELVNGSNGHNIKIVWETDLLKLPHETLATSLQWFDWSIPADIIEMQVTQVMKHHAKSTSRAYDPNEKKYEDNLLMNKYREDLNLALKWSEQHLSPHLKKL